MSHHKGSKLAYAATVIGLAFASPALSQQVPTSPGISATAGSYNFNFAVGNVTAAGTITTDTTGHATWITGLVNATDPITGLSSYAGADNNLYSTGAWVTFGGLSFSTASVGDFNLYNSGQGYYGFLSSVTNSSGTADGRFATANIAAVPEPTTWAMMLIGFAGIGYSTRRRRRADWIRQAA